MTAAIVWGVVYIVVLGAITMFFPLRVWRRSSQLRSELVVEFSDAEVTVQTLLGRSTTDWGYWGAAKSSDQLYRLSGTSGGGLLVPRRAFATPAEEEGFRTLLRRHLGTGFVEP